MGIIVNQIDLKADRDHLKETLYVMHHKMLATCSTEHQRGFVEGVYDLAIDMIDCLPVVGEELRFEG